MQNNFHDNPYQSPAEPLQDGGSTTKPETKKNPLALSLILAAIMFAIFYFQYGLARGLGAGVTGFIGAYWIIWRGEQLIEKKKLAVGKNDSPKA